MANMQWNRRINYCHSLPYGVTEIHIKKLQSATCPKFSSNIFSWSSRCSSITELLHDGHWLLVCSCINFKVNITAYITFQQQPSFMNVSSMFALYQILSQTMECTSCDRYCAGPQYPLLQLPQNHLHSHSSCAWHHLGTAWIVPRLRLFVLGSISWIVILFGFQVFGLVVGVCLNVSLIYAI